MYNNIKTQFSDNRYPFLCDFYIEKLDLFIEYNGHWTHGSHPFDINNKNDILKLKETISNDNKIIIFKL